MTADRAQAPLRTDWVARKIDNRGRDQPQWALFTRGDPRAKCPQAADVRTFDVNGCMFEAYVSAITIDNAEILGGDPLGNEEKIGE